jgi:hypothetical protein
MIENGYTIEIDRLRALTAYQQSIIESMRVNIQAKECIMDSVIVENFDLKNVLRELVLLVCANKEGKDVGGRWGMVRLEVVLEKATRMLENEG